MPLPSIEKTMDSYSKYLRVLMNNEDEIRHVQEIIGDFSKNLGPKLQMYLLNKRELTHNWVSNRTLFGLEMYKLESLIRKKKRFPRDKNFLKCSILFFAHLIKIKFTSVLITLK